jgi:hypothetical protein
MPESSEKYQQGYFRPENERKWKLPPEVKERDFAALEDIGGYYRGIIESSEGKRYEDIWRSINAIYDFTEHAFAKTCVETRAYGEGPRLQTATEIEEYRISIKYESLKEQNNTRQYKYVVSRQNTGVDHEVLRTIADAVTCSL